MALPDAARPGRELATRVVVGAALAVVALAAFAAGGLIFTALVALACFLAVREWMALNAISRKWRLFAGLIYICVPGLALLWLRNSMYGQEEVLLLFLIVWMADIGAFVVGRLLRGPRLWPTISPNKTWAGLGGAIIGGNLGMLLFACIYTGFSVSVFDKVHARVAFAATVMAVLAVGGDLFESWLKRRAGVKDSGTLLPGHGGVLDRLDSLIPVAPVAAAAVWMGWL